MMPTVASGMLIPSQICDGEGMPFMRMPSKLLSCTKTTIKAVPVVKALLTGEAIKLTTQPGQRKGKKFISDRPSSLLLFKRITFLFKFISVMCLQKNCFTYPIERYPLRTQLDPLEMLKQLRIEPVGHCRIVTPTMPLNL